MEDNKRMMTVVRSSVVFPVFTASESLCVLKGFLCHFSSISSILNFDFKN